MSTRALVLLAVVLTSLVAAGIAVNEAATATRTVDLRIAGMHCDSCAASLTKTLSRMPGVQAANVSFDTRTAHVVALRWRGPGDEALCGTVEEAGYSAVVAPQ